MDAQAATKIILNRFSLDGTKQLKRPIRGKRGITLETLICSIVESGSVQGAADILGYTDNPVKQCVRSELRPIFPDKPSEAFGAGGSFTHWGKLLINSVHLAKCWDCREILPLDRFYKDANNSIGVSHACKGCHVARIKMSKVDIKQRTPSWADKSAIRKVYRECPEGYHVDHVIPLHGTLVSGLHIESNLQYLLASDNLAKGNKFLT